MTRLIFPVAAVAIMLSGMPVEAQDNTAKTAPAAMGAMKCDMMAGMRGSESADVVAKLSAQKKALKLSDKQIRQIASALAASPEHDMAGMAECCDHAKTQN